VNGFAVKVPELRNEKSAPKTRKSLS
jgi:hypothetical protein